jgi:hypothetical protein
MCGVERIGMKALTDGNIINERRRRLIGISRTTLRGAVWMLLVLGWAAGLQAAESANAARFELAMTQRDILRFEGMLDSVISSSFSSNPFALVQKTKGAYLPDYGVSLSFLINIHRAVVSTPFGQLRNRDISAETKRQRIEELKEKLIKALQENGASISRLKKNERVTIIAYIEDRNFPDEPNSNKTIVMSVLKKDLDEFGGKLNRSQEFKQRMKIVEY